MDAIPWTISGNTVRWIGRLQKLYWISSLDHARQLAKAIGNPLANCKHYPVQGTTAMTYEEAIQRFIKVFDPRLKLKISPVWLVKTLGLLNAHFRFLGHMFPYFERTPDVFYASETLVDLGKLCFH